MNSTGFFAAGALGSGLQRLGASLSVLALVAGCSDTMDFDMRGRMGGTVDTSGAAQTAQVETRPQPDDRGVISYPGYQVAVAKRGDTLRDVATRIGLTAEELSRFNGIKPEDPLRQGEIVALPRRVEEPSQATGASVAGPIRPAPGVDVATLAGNAIDRAAPTAQPNAPVGSSGVEPIRHQVTRGETAFSISRLYGVSPRALAQWNSLDGNFTLREGQFLLIPVAQQREVAALAAPEPVPQPGAGSPTPEPPSASQPLPSETLPPVAAAPAAKPAKPVANIGQSQEPATDAAMVMPVPGSIIRDYAKGRNEGIDIAAASGTPVKAAASGKVASISTTAEGVKFLLIRHPDDLITVYTHLDDITVKKGDAVSRGQQVGKVKSGDPAFLHFEVRKGFDSTDPMPYLR